MARKPYSEWTEEQKEKRRISNRKSRLAHPLTEEQKAKNREYYRKWYAAHSQTEEQKEKRRVQNRKWYAAHREEWLEKMRKWNAEHPLTDAQKAKKSEYNRKWRETHREAKLSGDDAMRKSRAENKPKSHEIVKKKLTALEEKAKKREYARKWRAAHPLTDEQKEYQRIYHRQRRATYNRRVGVAVCEDEEQMQRQALKMRILNEQMLDNLLDVDDDGINCVDGERFESFDKYDEMTDLEEIRNRKEFYEGWQKEVKMMDDATMQELASASPFDYNPEDYNQNSTSDMHLYWWGDEDK